MIKIRDSLFFIWMLLLPFSWLISALTGITAPDKLLAPLLILLGISTIIQMPSARVKNVFFFITLASFLLVIMNISFISSGELFLEFLLDDGIKIGYFIVPLLCIDNLKTFNRTSWIIVFIAFVGGSSAFLASVELITLPIERFEASRIDVAELKKAIGLFTSYGDFSQYLTFSIMWVIVAPSIGATNKKYYMLARFIIFITIILALAGMQSRNVLLSIILSIGIFWLLKRIDASSSRSIRSIMAMVITFTVFVSIVVVSMFSTEIISFLSSIGGGLASNTANTRLGQYAFALNIIASYPVFGADIAAYTPAIEGVHNMWLRLAAHGGIVSVFVMLLILGKSFIGMRRLSLIPGRNKYSIVVTTYFVVMLFSVMFYVGMGQMFWALLGVATSLTCFDSTKDKLNIDQKLLEQNITTKPGNRRILASRRNDTQMNN